MVSLSWLSWAGTLRTVTITATASRTRKTLRGRWIVVVFRLEGSQYNGPKEAKGKQDKQGGNGEGGDDEESEQEHTMLGPHRSRWIKGGGKTATGRGQRTRRGAGQLCMGRQGSYYAMDKDSPKKRTRAELATAQSAKRRRSHDDIPGLSPAHVTCPRCDNICCDTTASTTRSPTAGAFTRFTLPRLSFLPRQTPLRPRFHPCRALAGRSRCLLRSRPLRILRLIRHPRLLSTSV